MPSGLLGLLALLFVAVPGHLYLVRYERHSLRERPGAAREITELFAVGTFGTLAAVAGVLVLAEAVPGLATLEGAASGGAYLRAHPWHLARSGILALTVSTLACAALGELRGRRNGGTWSNAPGTVWSELLKPSRGEADPEVHILMDDGTRVHGSGHMVSDERDPFFRDVALHHPIVIHPADAEQPQPSDADYVIIPGGHIRLIQITTVRTHRH
ncbi:hypothetical protein GPA10_25750 [Streptomyces sp. p1417]|uniref:Uncharacterized protein n=1 Tax=Streptomyces typhae TaxID=2681492 RepID=A0A6L6X2J6_9ACTN|nr:hypothetical protein [Streptomyces typhae]